MRQTARRATLISLILCLTPFVSSLAQTGWTGAGCWTCEYEHLLGSAARCHMVGNNEEGDGTDCYQVYVDDWGCWTNNVACYNTVVSGGGGGDGDTGGGSGGACNVGSGSLCPAECGACTRDPFRV
jgi:hypothetical protein